MKKDKPYWEMNTQELAEATKVFDDPDYHPPAKKPTAADRARWRRWQKKRQEARFRLTVLLDKQLVEAADDYAATHGRTVSDVVADALRQLMKKKSA